MERQTQPEDTPPIRQTGEFVGYVVHLVHVAV